MKISASVFLALLLLSCIAYPQEAGEEIDSKAEEYKGYDELVSNITPLSFHDQTYYWIEYTRNLQYSGEIVLNGSLEPERDESVLKVFSMAYVIHKSYPPESVRQWREFADYFDSVARFMNSSGNNSDQVEYARAISADLRECSHYMNLSVQSFDPSATEEYLSAESEALEKMDAAYQSYLDAKDDGREVSEDYGNSLLSIKQMLSDNRENLESAAEYMEESRYARTTPKGEQQTTELVLIILSALLMLFVFYIRSKRSNSSTQAPPPQA